MDGVQRLHDLLLHRRTQIRNHKTTQQLMRKCWKLAPHGDLESMALEEYEDLYSMLLYEMTICWEEEINSAILTKLWQRDASSFQDLNYDRFCCSLFFFVEMWADEVSQAAYDEIFNCIRLILSGRDPMDTVSSKSSSTALFKPTLESFNSALDNEKAMEELNISIGKSISFDAAQYYHQFGAPTTPPDSRVRGDRRDRSALNQQQRRQSPMSRLHTMPRVRPLSSSSTPRVGMPMSELQPSLSWKADTSTSDDMQLVLTGKPAISPTKTSSDHRD